jgi:hypothetical protein
MEVIMKRILLPLALFGAILPIKSENTLTTFIQDNKYPIAVVVTAGVAYGAYRAYNYFNSSQFSAYKRAIKDRLKKRYEASFTAYINYTLQTKHLDELIADKAEIIKDALNWLMPTPKHKNDGGSVARMKQRAADFNESYMENYNEKKEAFTELFDEVIVSKQLDSI